MAENERFVPDEQGSVLESKRGCGMTDNDCEKIIELCWWHLATCELADCIIDSCDIMSEGLE